MLFNSDPSNPAQEMLFSRKKRVHIHPSISLYNILVERTSNHKHLDILLDEKLNFKQHVNSTFLKINKGISLIKELRHYLAWKSLMTIYKAFLRPQTGYRDIIYDQPQNEYFCEKLASVQYKAALAMGAIQGTSCDQIYQEFRLEESLKSRRWYEGLGCMFKIMKEEASNYLINLVPKCGEKKQGTTRWAYAPSTAKQTVSSTLFFLLP